jgi:hypothetical protein
MIQRSLKSSLAAVAIAALTGCAGSMPSNFGIEPTVPGTLHASGKVYGGQNPVSGSTIQLYTVGTTGLKSASTALIASPGTTDASGSFNITAKYSCTGTTPGTQVYIVASGGDSGSGNNANLTLAAALGSCSYLLSNAANVDIFINEITTVAAAYALAPFATDLTHIGASGSNPNGLVNAFANAQLIANYSTGVAGGPSLPAGATVPTAEINTLGNILAACANSNGTPSGGCNALFSATGATDTFDAALAMAKNPGAAAITALASLSVAQAPFQPSMSGAPNDFTVAVNFTGYGGLATPYAIALDAAGDAWVANESGSNVTELSPSGSLLASPTASGLYGAQGIAVDRTGDVWVANTAGNSVVKFTLTAGSVTGNSTYTVGGTSAPSAVALDSANNVFVANFNGNSVTELSSAGAALNGSPFTGSSNNITTPSGIALDASGNVYVTSGQGTAVKLTNAGVYAATLTDNTLQGPLALALDGSAYVVLDGFTTGTTTSGAVSEFSAAGTPTLAAPINSGTATPAGAASDGTSFWITYDNGSGSLAQITYGSATVTSPTAGFGSLSSPVGVAVDSSGSVWTANSGNNTVSKFIGLAVPVVTPLSANVGP